MKNQTTVKELIERLQQEDGNMPVFFAYPQSLNNPRFMMVDPVCHISAQKLCDFPYGNAKKVIDDPDNDRLDRRNAFVAVVLS